MLKVFEAFAGIGAQRMALRNIGVDFEVVGISEVDKYALNSYKAIHGDCPNYGDISKINPKDLPEIDLFTYSFPCQDISIAGKQEGIIRERTRSGLLYECEKIIEYCRPKYLLMENVKNLIGKKNKSNFEEWLKYLESLGYTNYWQVLNAKHYGIPQNRERVFVVSILGKHKPYEFPKGFKLEKNIKSMLEDGVDIKYYLSDEAVRKFVPNKNFTTAAITQLITTKGKEITHNTICEQRCDEGLRFFKNDICGTIRTINSGGDKRVIETKHSFRIRKLTPKECFRLMGLNDEDIEKIQSIGTSNAQQYKQAGNSIVVPVLEGIFKELLINE